MDDRSVPPARPEAALPEDDLAAALRALLAAGTGARNAGGNGSPAEDAAAVAGRVEALARADVAGYADDVTLLADLGHALAEVEGGAAQRPSAAVLAAAREAFAREERVAASAVASATPHVRLPGPRGEARTSRRASPAWTRAVAAVLVVGLGVAWFVRARAADAGPVLALAGLDRYAVGAEGAGAASVVVGGRLEARPGVAFVAGKDEVLALRLADGGRLLLRGGERLEVAAGDGSAGDGEPEDRALLTLSGGEVLLSADAEGDGGHVALLLSAPGGARLGVLVLLRGEAHVAQPPGREGTPAVALADGAVARYFPAAGRTPASAPVDLRGPAHVLLAETGTVAAGEPARGLFRDLEVFGGPRRAPKVEPFVSARVWRAVSGRAERGDEGLTLRGPEVALAWRPDPSASTARTLRLLLRGPEGLRVALPDVGTSATLSAAAGEAEPGLVTLDLPLPEGWAFALPRGELRLAFDWSAVPRDGVASRTLRFDGAFLGGR